MNRVGTYFQLLVYYDHVDIDLVDIDLVDIDFVDNALADIQQVWDVLQQ